MKHLGVIKNLIKNDSVLLLKLEFGGGFSVPNPDLEIRGGGQSPKKFFGPLGPQFGRKIRGPLPTRSTIGFSCLREEKYITNTQRKPPPPPLDPPLVFLEEKYTRNTQRKTPLCKEGN